MFGRNDAAITTDLEAVTQTMQNHPNAESANFGGLDVEIALGIWLDCVEIAAEKPYGAQEWLKEIERIFRVMDCSTVQKSLEAIGEVITWAMFTREFLRKYFPEDVWGKKEMEFLALKQGNSTITEYVAKLVELYKSLNEKREKLNLGHKKPYDAPTEKGKQKVSEWKKTSWRGAPASVRCYSCGEQGHRSNECENKGHISTQCQKIKKDAGAGKTNSRVFSLSGTEDSKKGNLI
ncbi:uncharacterized protein LOC131597995 [Vicia villosa]|uniref:uncharacterized protein LOC131597995 n=1 Tax=Vicia villosa TaxID=3911 RepID=UPI00273C1C06|nr:uncharacterized protein LOC131597995 [Vicia villosa]